LIHQITDQKSISIQNTISRDITKSTVIMKKLELTRFFQQEWKKVCTENNLEGNNYEQSFLQSHLIKLRIIQTCPHLKLSKKTDTDEKYGYM